MNILVNNKRLDFELENEKKLSDVLIDLEKWVTHNDNVISNIKIDDKEIDIDDIYIKDMELSKIKTITIETKNKLDLAFDTLDTMNQYCGLLESYLEDDIFKVNDSIMEGLEMLEEGFELSLKILKINPLMVYNKGADLKTLLKDIKDLKTEYERKFLDDNGVKKINEILENLKSMIVKVYKWGIIKNFNKFRNENLKELPFIKEILKDYIVSGKNALSRFSKVTEDLQVGDDLSAFEGIYYISDILNETVELLKALRHIFDDFDNSKNIDFKNIYEEINVIFNKITDNLKEIEKAFLNEDMITIGDLLEYEIKPLFEELIIKFERINDFI